MIHKKIFALALVVVVVMGACVQAGSIGGGVTDNNNATDSTGADLTNYTTNDIWVNSDPGELVGAIQLWLELTSGTIFNHAFGSNTPPNPAQFGLVPALEFDTYLASGVPANTFNPVIAGASVDFGSPGTGGGAVFDMNTVDATFGPQAGQPTGGVSNFLVGRFTLSNDAAGTLRMKVDFSGEGPDAEITREFSMGTIFGTMEPNTPPSLVPIVLNHDLNTDPPISNLQLTATDAEQAVGELIWSDLVYAGGPGKNFGGAADATMDADGLFSWNPAGWRQGAHTFNATVSDGVGGLTTGLALTVNLTVPEPATFAMLGLAMVGVVGVIRRRS